MPRLSQRAKVAIALLAIGSLTTAIVATVLEMSYDQQGQHFRAIVAVTAVGIGLVVALAVALVSPAKLERTIDSSLRWVSAAAILMFAIAALTALFDWIWPHGLRQFLVISAGLLLENFWIIIGTLIGLLIVRRVLLFMLRVERALASIERHIVERGERYSDNDE
ncbi:MAG TPA: hypothetical protein VJO53_01255 [Candidatus Acidoferrales bacterium]|nr:hypothetical protein [Candidatus Acidoferrales bacterium]